jgi:hypothetical protein
MAKVDGSIGIGQGAGDENLTWLGHGGSATYLARVKMRVIGHYKGPAKIFHPKHASADD